MLGLIGTQYSVEIVDGRPRVRCGQPPHGFVAACGDIARLYGIRRGRIDCVGSGSWARLRFRDIPERARQPLRNVWTPPAAVGRGGGRRA